MRDLNRNSLYNNINELQDSWIINVGAQKMTKPT